MNENSRLRKKNHKKHKTKERNDHAVRYGQNRQMNYVGKKQFLQWDKQKRFYHYN